MRLIATPKSNPPDSDHDLLDLIQDLDVEVLDCVSEGFELADNVFVIEVNLFNLDLLRFVVSPYYNLTVDIDPITIH